MPLLIAAGALMVVALVLHRRSPYAALAAILLAGLAVEPGSLPIELPAAVVLYTIAAGRGWRPAAIGAAGVVVAHVASELTWGETPNLGETLSSIVLCGAAIAFGLYVGARRAAMDALRERAERMDRERELLAARAVAEERLRIAQELHDVVAHNVSLIVVQAQALGATAADERVTTATDGIADLGRQTMTEMHRTLQLLRAGDADGPDLAPQPGLAALDGLLERTRAAGVDVSLSIEGEPRPLPQTLDLSAYRIVQEALTNVLKHAGGAGATVTVAYRPDAIALDDHRQRRGRRTGAVQRQRRRPRPRGNARARRAVRRHVAGGPARGSRVRGRRRPALPAPMSRLRVVIADDQPLMRAGFRAVLEAAGDIEVVAEAGSGEEAIAAAAEHAPDVILMDIRMPGMNGIEATRKLPRQRVLILTTFGLDEYIIDALRAGASGFMLKDAPTQELVRAVRSVAAGDAVLSPAVTRQLLDQVARRLPAAVSRAAEALTPLTDREREVLRMLAAGLSNAEIAAALVVSEATVKTHVSNLLGKLGLRDRVQAVIYAYETGLIAPTEAGG